MREYEDFRVGLNPDVGQPGRWSVVVRKAPIPGLVGKHESVQPVLLRQDLKRLRSRQGWPDVDSLKNIGSAVWESVLRGQVGAAFEASLTLAIEQGKCLRLVLVIQGDENEEVDETRVRLSELPVEALYAEAHHFIATDLQTPISRSFQDEPDRDPEQIALPLRLLVFVAAPVDKPPASVVEEEEALLKAVRKIDPTSSVLKVEVVRQATRDSLAKLLEKRYDILHFIGHGGFEIVGDDPTPRAHICLVRRDGTERSDNVDADTLANALRNSQVRLVVMTACATAAPTPDAEPYGISAFEGVAQRLVTGNSGATAAVAMQFDLESDAAVEFTQSFYGQLLRSDVSLDEAVTFARKQLVNQLNAGHRAWVTPTVFWRCKSAQVFMADPSLSELDPAVASQLQEVDISLKLVRSQIDQINREPADLRPAFANVLNGMRTQVQELEMQRGQLLGESLRVHGGVTRPGEELELGLWLRTRATGPVGMLNFDLRYPADALTPAGSGPGEASPDKYPAVAVKEPGRLQVVIVNPSGDGSWAPGDRQIGVLRFKVADALEARIVDLRIVAPTITRDNGQVELRPVDGVVFVDA